MSVAYQEIFGVATHLVSQKQADGSCCEASLRSAASRAYYAALHAAKQSIPDQFAPESAELESKDSHKKIIDAVIAWGNSVTPGRTEAKTMARELPRLKRLRKNADYAILNDFSAGDAEEAIERATTIIENVRRALDKSQALETA